MENKYESNNGQVDSKVDVEDDTLVVDDEIDQIGEKMNKRLERKLDMYIIPIFGVSCSSFMI
jgi:hypothetical protein